MNNTTKCPECGTTAFAEFEDVGVGHIQVGPFVCPKCHWTEDCPYVDSCPGDKCKSYSYCSHAKKPEESQTPLQNTFQNIKDEMSMKLYGRKNSECIQDKICVICGESAQEFKDKLSEKEFAISGLCQTCQDKTFGCRELDTEMRY